MMPNCQTRALCRASVARTGCLVHKRNSYQLDAAFGQSKRICRKRTKARRFCSVWASKKSTEPSMEEGPRLSRRTALSLGSLSFFFWPVAETLAATTRQPLVLDKPAPAPAPSSFSAPFSAPEPIGTSELTADPAASDTMGEAVSEVVSEAAAQLKSAAAASTDQLNSALADLTSGFKDIDLESAISPLNGVSTETWITGGAGFAIGGIVVGTIALGKDQALATAQAQLSAAEDRITSLQAQLSQLQTNLSTSTKNLAELQVQLEAEQRQATLSIDDANTKLTALNNKVKELQAALLLAKDEKAAIERTLKAEIAAKEQSEAGIKEANKKGVKLLEELESVCMERDIALRNADMRTDENANLMSQLRKSQESASKTEKELQDARSDIAELTASLGNLEASKARLEDDLRVAENNIQQLTHNLANTNDELDQTMESLREEQARGKELEATLADYRERINKLEGSLDSEQQRSQNLESLLHEASGHLENTTKELEVAQRQADELEQRLTTELDRSTTLAEELVEATHSLEEANNQIQAERQKIDVLEKARAAAVEDTKRLLAAERDRKFELDEAMDRVRGLQDSLMESEQRVAVLESQHNTFAKSVTESAEQITHLQGELSKAQGEAEWARNAYLTERSAKEEAEKNVLVSQREAEEAAQREQEALASVEAEQQLRMQVQQYAEDIKGMLKETQAKNASLQHDLSAAQQEAQRMGNERDKLERQLQTALVKQEQLKDAKQQVAMLSNELQTITAVAKGDIRKLNLELIQTKGEADAMRQELAVTKGALTNAEENAQRLKQQLTDALEQLEQTKQMLSSTRQELEAMASESAGAQVQMKELEAVEEELEAVRTAYIEAQEQLSKWPISDDEDDQTAELARLSSELTEKQAELESTRAKINELQAQLASTQQLLAAVREEAAWGNTTPGPLDRPTDLVNLNSGSLTIDIKDFNVPLTPGQQAEVERRIREAREQAKQAAIEVRAQAALMVESVEDRCAEAVEEAQAKAAAFAAEAERLRNELASNGGSQN